MKMYHASSLEQIAAMFEQNAWRDREAAKRATTMTKKSSELARAITWEAAATILRNTELHINAK